MFSSLNELISYLPVTSCGGALIDFPTSANSSNISNSSTLFLSRILPPFFSSATAGPFSSELPVKIRQRQLITALAFWYLKKNDLFALKFATCKQTYSLHQTKKLLTSFSLSSLNWQSARVCVLEECGCWREQRTVREQAKELNEMPAHSHWVLCAAAKCV